MSCTSYGICLRALHSPILCLPTSICCIDCINENQDISLLGYQCCFIAMLPEMFLVYQWKGITRPIARSLFMFRPAMINIWKMGAVIGLLSLPIIVGCIRRSLDDVLPQWWGARSTVVAFAGLLVFIMSLVVHCDGTGCLDGFRGGISERLVAGCWFHLSPKSNSSVL